MAFTLYQPKPPEPDRGGLDITDFQLGGIQYTSETETNNSPPVYARDEDNPGLASFYVMVFVWHCMTSVIVITFCHAMMRAVAVCIYRRVLQQKVARGEDLSMLNPTPNEV